ncbi:MAG TPA: alanine--tRNA ligase [Bacteroidales bacterium]|nr:alanine--tRNA ligase [Bacteroidales bacterium]
MKSKLVRKAFLDFFESKKHFIVNSAPMVVKNDPTLMFTNAGMNQFKDIFLGNTLASHPRIANTQKCLRVSGKHNDLEEVGHDTYHHTMFEMLGNWSFGDYFKREAILWAWELLTDVYKIEKDRLYVTVFEGDEADGLEPDEEAFTHWKEILSGDRIIFADKNDNFWEMGDTGPCGPCSEIHVDLRSDDERRTIPGKDLVNKDHPLVVEIWNLVFIQYNRMSNGQLMLLPDKHIDTGMGFERLCMALQGKKSNYDTDIFQPYILKLSEMAGTPYGSGQMTDVAMRVVADHLRAVAFAIADGETPSNNKGGYVIRRILRRAIRYGYTFLLFREPFVFKLVPVLVDTMGQAFPELAAQQSLVEKVIEQEEATFLRTLELGIQKFEQYIAQNPNLKVIDGQFAFELYDTYGFPVDLTCLMAKEHQWDVDMEGFEAGMKNQKTRSRAAAIVETGDWIEVRPAMAETEFLGYELLESEVELLKYRKVSGKGKSYFQLVLDKTPFYAESGGQVGDRGRLTASNGTQIEIVDTQKENNLIVHLAENVPQKMPAHFVAKVDVEKRKLTECNHTATHLMHSALVQVLGNHVQQKGSLVDEQRLRFDFSHYTRVTPEQIAKIEHIVNAKIRDNIPQEDHRELHMEEAKKMNAVALFGEKYGEKVRVVAFDRNFSTELCGGTHVHSTGQIGLFRIVSEGAIAAGIRRIEAVTGESAENFVDQKIHELNELRALLKNPKNSVQTLMQLLEQNDELRKKSEIFQKQQASQMIDVLSEKVEKINGINFIGHCEEMSAELAKDLAFAVKSKLDNLLLVLCYQSDRKPGFAIMISENLVEERKLHAGNMVRSLAVHIQGGGGGQAFFATAGGKKTEGLVRIIEEARKYIS